MPLDPTQRPPLMCLTQDGLALSHAEQAARLCAAGARWIQLRMKHADAKTWVDTARAVTAICRAAGAICIINDSVDVALASGADGVHLNWHDEDWTQARQRLGTKPILGGTVNNADDAARALRTDGLDYVGIGPWRFTATKQKLAPVLGASGVRSLVAQLDGLPAWAIGGIQAFDLPAVRQTGATGVAVSSVLYRDSQIEENYGGLAEAWAAAGKALRS